MRPTQTQNFNYDERDRLIQAWTTGNAANSYNESYAYNNIGNLTSKAGTTYTYPAAGSARPHTPTTVGGTSYLYDANGNLTGGSGRTYSWNAENLPTTISYTGGSENYSYDADGERVKVVNGSTTTVYLEGLWDEVAGGTTKVYDPFNGQAVALRDTSANTVTYLHSDHLGSISVETTSSGTLLNSQEFDPWGKVRLGAVSQTSRNYTGQILDGSKLLYYHARYYDPLLGRFVSADSVVPGVGALAVTPSDEIAAELFKQGGKTRDGKPNAPQNPQTLNRYSYAENNPILKTDPSGHCDFIGIFNGNCLRKALAIYLSPRATPEEKWFGFGYAQLNLVPVAIGTALAGMGAIAVAGAATAKAAAEAATAQSVLDKLQRYLLNPEHPEGGSKAKWFEQALGYTKDNMASLAKQIVFDPSRATQTQVTPYGVKFNQVITIVGANDKRIDVLFAWIRNNDGIVRLVTAIPPDRR